MGKSRMMGAGFAGSLTRRVNVNGNSGGGNKKQGLVSMTGFGNRTFRHVRTRSIGAPTDRFRICFTNQLGGVGKGRSMFNVPGMYTNVHGSFGPRKYPDRACYYGAPYNWMNT